jgi:hypothetical protein
MTTKLKSREYLLYVKELVYGLWHTLSHLIQQSHEEVPCYPHFVDDITEDLKFCHFPKTTGMLRGKLRTNPGCWCLL